MGIPYVPVLGLAGSDVAARRSDFTIAPNPFNPEEKFVVAKAINPDVAIFHCAKADRAGNVLTRKKGNEMLLAQASRKVIVTAEEIVDKLSLDDAPGRFMPGVHVTAVVRAPFGAYPTEATGYYDEDEEQILEYVKASDSDEAFSRYLDKNVFAFDSHDAYLESRRLSPARVAAAL
ncbi:MAG: hypothetical protein HY666_04680 [Chloroflexi bacterium]|nr:hypothetical protein [Chloroflexota bacterium]